ncbi:unnamed protein product [Rotaria sp. Silwood1]|nr:unnamed protein product [Rotaria sp. Silwood1]CAF1669071.1 unnamed protein product [Rotaria sp. Silwood1]
MNICDGDRLVTLNGQDEHSIIQGNLQETMINILELDFLFEQIVNQPFVQLPMVTPEQIELSRRIQRFFTDDLEAPVICELNFPVNDDEEEEEEEDMDEETMNLHQIKFDINTNFEGNRLEDLALSHGQYWVHCAYTVGDRYHFKNIYIGWEIDDPTIEEDIELFKSSILLSSREDEEFEDNIE